MFSPSGSRLETPPPRKSRALPDLQFLKSATVASLQGPQNRHQLKFLSEMRSWYQAAAQAMRKRAELCDDIVDGCERVLGIMEAIRCAKPKLENCEIAGTADLKTLREITKDMNVKGHVNPDGVLQQATKSEHLIFQDDIFGEESSSNPSREMGQEPALKPPKAQTLDAPVEITDPTALQNRAQELIQHLNILRARWQAGGKNFESVAGMGHKQSKRGGAGAK